MVFGDNSLDNELTRCKITETYVCVPPDDWDYTTVHDRRSLYRSAMGGQWVTVSGLIPYTTYYVQVNASNSKGFELSNNMHADMPMGCKYVQTYFSTCLFFISDQVCHV